MTGKSCKGNLPINIRHLIKTSWNFEYLRISGVNAFYKIFVGSYSGYTGYAIIYEVIIKKSGYKENGYNNKTGCNKKPGITKNWL